MKLRNKKTGEIVDFSYLQSDYIAPLVLTTYENDKPKMYKYTSLAELNAEWEDYAEPKEYWCIDWTEPDGIYRTVYKDEWDDFNKEIGNYFETKEEAEKAVERLRAWKRLKDARLKFTDFGYNLDELSSSLIGADGKICFEMMCYEDFADDLELLFGGEE